MRPTFMLPDIEIDGMVILLFTGFLENWRQIITSISGKINGSSHIALFKSLRLLL